MSAPVGPPTWTFAPPTPQGRGPEWTLGLLVLAILGGLAALGFLFGTAGACLMAVPPPNYYDRARLAVAGLAIAAVPAFARAISLMRPTAAERGRLSALWVLVGTGCLGLAALTFSNIHPTMICGVPPFQ